MAANGAELKDAQQDPGELPDLADYLGVDPSELGQRIKGRRFELPNGVYIYIPRSIHNGFP